MLWIHEGIEMSVPITQNKKRAFEEKKEAFGLFFL